MAKYNLSDEELNKKALQDSLEQYRQKRQAKDEERHGGETSQQITEEHPQASANNIPHQESTPYQPPSAQPSMGRETDPDLIVGYERVNLPSEGKFYADGLASVDVEYLTTRDEDILTTPSLIQDGTVLDVILKRKIKTAGVDIDKLLTGDKNAIILFLRASSYGADYEVSVRHPKTNKTFKQTVDLRKLKVKEVSEKPDANGCFHVHVPMRKKDIIFRLLTSGEERTLEKKAEAIKEAYNHEYSEYSTMKLKAHIVSIDGETSRDYISRFVDAMPVRDTLTIRKKILDVSPDIDMTYQFKAPDGLKFEAVMSVGVDFFFPSL